MTARARAGCQACRVRHLKCDQAIPVCGRCKDFDRECVRGYPYRKYKHDKFGRNQKWMKTPSEFTWEDETNKLAINYDNSEDEDESPQQLSDNESATSFSTPRTSQAETPKSPFRPRSGLRSNVGTPKTTTSTPRDQATPVQRVERHQSLPRIPGVSQHDFAISHLPSPVPSSSKGVSEHEPSSIASFTELSFTGHEHVFDEPLDLDPSPPIYLDRPIWPLTDPAEALLLRHFVQNLAIWLDLCDPMQHFQVEVPQRAGTCPILLNAIFALSARHLSIIGKYDTFASNRYHEECLKHLIPMLSNSATVGDETLFAATIILRVLEEIDLLEADLQSHMLGITVFVSTSLLSPLSPPPGLWQAAFWVGLRQEIYIATIKHHPVSLPLSHSLIDRSVSPASDFSWANRAVVHCADVLNCCFGDKSGAGWWELREQSERWKECKPSSFTPIYWREPDPARQEVFPEIWHSHACHIIGVQHHKLAQILLSIFDPRIPKVGGAARVAIRAMEAEVRPLLLELCGIGMFNRWTPPGMFTASMGIAICGDRFESRQEQQALLDVLVRTESDHARPTAAVQRQMREAWGW